MQKIELRERGIYSLPDGDEFVASFARGGGYALYDLQIWKRYGMPDYEIDAKGRMTKAGQSTPWRVEDLKDTGRTAQ